MALGSTLAADVELALNNSTDAEASSALMASAVNSYLSDAEYGEGALTYSGTIPDDAFKLPTSGTVASAATQWSTAIMNYWLPAGTAVGVPAEPTELDSVVSGTIVATTVSAELLIAFTEVFSDISTDSTGEKGYKASEIASAIETAVGNIVVNWIEFAAGPPPVTSPFIGGVS